MAIVAMTPPNRRPQRRIHGRPSAMSRGFSNFIARNFDCLIANSRNRLPIFWMFVRDEAPDRAYVQLMMAYRSDPTLS